MPGFLLPPALPHRRTAIKRRIKPPEKARSRTVTWEFVHDGRALAWHVTVAGCSSAGRHQLTESAGPFPSPLTAPLVPPIFGTPGWRRLHTWRQAGAGRAYQPNADLMT